jgi:type I restriction-modification system DNA methylase subunit
MNNNFSERANFIWSVADLIRDDFKRSKYQDVILPLTVLRRIDCVLASTKPAVLERNAKLKGKLDNLHPQLCDASGFAFYNTSLYDFERLVADAPNLATNLRAYMNGFSDNMREVLEKFDFNNTIAKLDEAGLLFKVVEKFKEIDLHPDKVSNIEMGYIFEELIRRFNEALNENPGEHFTPREVIGLMVNLLLSQDAEALSHNHIVRTVYDPCCGSGGMLTISKERICEINQLEDYRFYGKEDIQRFAEIYFALAVNQDKLYSVLQSPLDRYKEATKEDQAEFKGTLRDYIRLYAFISQILPFADPELEKRLAVDQSLVNSVKVNSRENARLTFDIIVNEQLQKMIDTNFKFYAQITDKPDFFKMFMDWLFDRYMKSLRLQETSPIKV